MAKLASVPDPDGPQLPEPGTWYTDSQIAAVLAIHTRCLEESFLGREPDSPAPRHLTVVRQP